MIDAYRVQEIFQAICLHLNSEKYSFFMYNGKVKKVPRPTLFAEIIGNRFDKEADLVQFFIANQIAYYLDNNKVSTWIGHFGNKEAMSAYSKHNAFLESQTYRLKSDLKVLISLKKQIYSIQAIYPLVVQGKVSIITVTNFLIYMKMDKKWENDDPLLSDFFRFLKRIAPFLIIPKENFQKAIEDLVKPI